MLAVVWPLKVLRSRNVPADFAAQVYNKLGDFDVDADVDASEAG